MTLIPEEHLTKRSMINFAPMVDFLFVIIALFAALAITKNVFYDCSLNLKKLEKNGKKAQKSFPINSYVINLSVAPDGTYHYLKPHETLVLEGINHVHTILKEELEKTQPSQEIELLLHIDKEAHWEAIATLIFAAHEHDLMVKPVFTPTSEQNLTILH